MKKLHFLILISVVLCATLAFTLVGCNKDALASPEKLEFDGPTLTLSWKEVKDAVYYVVNISGNGESTDKNTRKNSLSLSNMKLDEGEYQLRVKAVGNGNVESEWSSPLSFAQDKDTGLTFRFSTDYKTAEISGLGKAEGDIVLPDTYRGVPVTRIGDRAFASKSRLTGIVMSDNIVSVGASAFYNCTFLKNVTFSKNLKTIGERAFQSCRLLEGNLNLPSSLEAIGENAFVYCTSITGVAIGNNLESIGVNAFSYCEKLTSIVIPDNVKSIGNSAFYGCKLLSSVQLGKGVENLGEYAFAECKALKTINFNEGLVSIGNYAFGKCTELKTAVFSSTVKAVGEGAFYQCSKLDDVRLNAGLNRIFTGAFNETKLWNDSANEVYLSGWFLGCKDKKAVTNINIANGTVGIANSALAGFENLPQVILPNSVKIIGDAAFAYSKVSSVVIGSGVEEIGVQAFYKCESLTTCILGSYDFNEGKLAASSLKLINEYAFQGCSRLENIEIPNTVEVISTYAFNDSALYKNASNGVVYAGNWLVGCDNSRANGVIVIEDGTVGIANYAFNKCTNISGVEIPDSVKTIGRAAFYNCSNLAAVTLPSGLEAIEDYTFYNCTQLVLPQLPDTLKKIGRSAFYKCALKNATGTDTQNDELRIPDSVESIGAYAFFGCGYVTYDLELGLVNQCGIDVVILGDGVKSIGENAFNAISTLKKVVLGASVEEIGARAFYNCAGLKEVSFNAGLKSIGARAFYGCAGLEEVSLPDGLLKVDDYAFYKCVGLKKVNFGANTREIGRYAFYGCTALESLNLPATVETIGAHAFRSCRNLKSVVLKSGVVNIAEHAFYGCKALTIYAQDSSAKEGWNARFNSGYRPVVWGCEIKDGYVYAVTKTSSTLSNINTVNVVSAPERDGYTFVGWATSENATVAEYAAENISDAPDGTKLFAVWTQITE